RKQRTTEPRNLRQAKRRLRVIEPRKRRLIVARRQQAIEAVRKRGATKAQKQQVIKEREQQALLITLPLRPKRPNQVATPVVL
ncbi:hypothetical protein FRC18_005262, partial [Serendipita sp. 400]